MPRYNPDLAEWLASKSASSAGEVAGVAGKKVVATPGFLKMLMGGKGLGVAAKANPMGAFSTGLGALFILQMIMGQMKKAGGTFLQQNLESQQIEGQTGRSSEDVYYQSMLPQLSQQRQTAQNALLQAIMSGSGAGEQSMVPGERRIGGY